MRGHRLFVILLLFGTTVIGSLMITSGYRETWMLWQFNPMPLSFSDLRVITAGAESRREGLDPMVDNARDPWKRQLNYPRIWQQISHLGISQNHTVPIALLMIVAFFASMFLWPRKLTRGGAIVLFLGLLSPPVMMALERGNIDLLIFTLCALALYSLNWRYWIACTWILIGMVLKLFPIVGLLFLLREKPRVLLTLFGWCAAVTIGYVILTYQDLSIINDATPRSPIFSYGCKVVAFMWRDRGGLTTIESWRALEVLLFFLIIGSVASGFLIDRLWPTPVQTDHKHMDAFRLGAGIYIGTFLLGNNWDYRLVFLLFTFPQLWAWCLTSIKPLRVGARLGLVVAAISLWSWFIEPIFGILANGAAAWVWIDEIANWLLFGTLSYLVITTLPEWIPRLWQRKEPQPDKKTTVGITP